MIFLYIIYEVLSAALLVFISQNNKKEWLLKMLVISFVPIIGWFLPIIWSKKMFKNRGIEFGEYMKKQNEDIPIEILSKKEKIEREKELNIIPIEEALIVSDYASRRKAMLDVLKKDAIQYMDVIKMAVLNEDTETSHFAVTAVLEVKRKLTLSMQTFSVEFEKNPQDLDIAKSYAQVLKEYMRSGFLDELTLRKFKYTYIHVLKKMIDSNNGDPLTFEEKIRVELELHEYNAAEETGLKYLQKYPNIENSYISLLNVYYETKSKRKMEQILEELMSSTIKFSNRALTIVRYWTGGNEYASKSELL